MRVDDVGHGQSLVAGALHQRVGVVRRVYEDALSCVAVTEQVSKVPVAAGAELFEDQLHWDANRLEKRELRSNAIALASGRDEW